MVMRYRRRVDEVDALRGGRDPSGVWQYFAQEFSEILGEIIEGDELLSHCYCGQRLRDFDESFLPAVITDLSPGVLASLRESEDAAEWLIARVEQLEPKKPWIVVGPPGCGKTTFLHRFFRVETERLGIKDKIIPIFIDLKDEADPRRVQNVIWSNVIQICCKYHPELSDLRPELARIVFGKDLGPYRGLFESAWWQSPDMATKLLHRIIADQLQPDRQLWAKRLHEYMSENSPDRRLVLILDNIDHKPIEFQREVFKASAFAVRELSIPTIVAMRNYTYPAAYQHMDMTVWTPRHLNLRAPDLRAVLRMRFNYLLKFSVPRRYGEIAEKGWTLKIEEWGKKIQSTKDVQDIVKAITDAILTRSVLFLLEQLSGENIRFMLQIVGRTLQSGWLLSHQSVETKDKLKFRFQTGDIIRALLLGNNWYMDTKDPSASVINVFDNPEAVPAEGRMSWVLAAVRLLQVVDFYTAQGVAVSAVLDCLESLGYDREGVKRRIWEYLYRGLITSVFDIVPLPQMEMLPDEIVIKLSKAGKFLLEELCTNFDYVETVKWATYAPADVYENMASLQKHRADDSALNRLKATQEFVSFLIQEDVKDIASVHNIGSGASPVLRYFFEQNSSGSVFGRKLEKGLLEAATGMLKPEALSELIAAIPERTIGGLGLTRESLKGLAANEPALSP